MIFGPLAKHRATVWRTTKPRSRKAPAPYEQVLDEGEGPVFVRCRFATGGRRVYGTDGANTLGDARLTYRVGRPITIQEKDLVRHEPEGETYKVLRVDKATGIASRHTYALLTLEATDQIVGATSPATEEVPA